MDRQSRMPKMRTLRRNSDVSGTLASRQRFGFRIDALNPVFAVVLMTALLLVSSNIVACQPSSTALVGGLTQERLKSDSTDDSWRAIFFKEINRRAKLAGLHRLDSATLAGDDLEVRVWIGFGLLPLQGFVFARKGGRWSGLHLLPVSPGLSRRNYQQALTSPNSGWDELWNRLTREGILTLPDSSQLKNEVVVFDGEHFVVEIRANGTYRTYRYSNPEVQKWPEAKHMIRIVEIIFAEFSIQRRLPDSGKKS